MTCISSKLDAIVLVKKYKSRKESWMLETVHVEKSLGHKKWQVTYIAPLNHVPLLCSHPGGLAGAGRIRLAAANVIVILM